MKNKPVGMGRGQQEHEFYHTEVLAKLMMLETAEVICDVCTTHVHLQGGHTHQLVGMVEEIVKDIVDWCLWHDQLLEILGTEIVAVHIDGREEDFLYLVVAELVSRLVSSDEDLTGTQGDLGVFLFVQGRQLGEDGVKVVSQTWLLLEQVILKRKGIFMSIISQAVRVIVKNESQGRFNIKMSYQYRNYHYKCMIISRQ